MDTSNDNSSQTAPATAYRFNSPWLFAGASLVVLILMFGRSMMRTFDMDEHQFVAPSVFLTEAGLLPYRNYPYFHMPHLVYIHAAASVWVAHKLLAARTVSVLCGWVTVLLLFRAGWKAFDGQSAPTRWMLIGGVLAAYLCSQLFAYANGWAWNHDSAILCAVAAVLAQLRGMRKGHVGLIGLAGVLAGLAMGIRLSFAPIIVPMGILLWLGKTPLTWGKRGMAFALAVGGALLMLTPAFIPWIEERDAFVFGNLGYVDLNTRFYARTDARYMTFAGKFVYLFRKFFSDPGNAFVFLLGTYGMSVAYWKQRAWQSRFSNELGLVIGLMPMLLLGAWGPTPTQQQYFYALMPFLALAGFYAMALECSDARGLRRWRRLVLFGALLPAIVGLPRWYWQVVYLPVVEGWTPMRVHETGAWIKSQCPPGARVMTADPVFVQEGGLAAYPEYAVGRFVFHVGDLMNPEDRRRFHMTYAEELDRVLGERPPDAIFRHTKSPTTPLTAYASSHGFRKLDYQFSNWDLHQTQENFELWVREPSSEPHKSP